MTPVKLKILLFVFGLPGAFLMFAFVFMVNVVQRRYIVKRYETETGLADKERFFEGYRSIISLYPLTRSVFYSTHLLLIMLLSDRTLKKKPHFKGSPDREVLLSHFSKKERILTLVTFGCAVVGVVLLCTFGFLDWFWRR